MLASIVTVLFLATRKIVELHLPLRVERKVMSDFLYVPSAAPVARYTVSGLNGSRSPGTVLEALPGAVVIVSIKTIYSEPDPKS